MLKEKLTAGFVLLFLIFCGAGALRAQEIPFERFIGEWKGSGKVNGLASEISMEWAKVLGGKYMRLSFSNLMKSPKGDILFEGIALYRIPKSGVLETTGSWFDSFGANYPIKSVFTKDSLESDWGKPEAEEGKTIYRLVDADKMEVVDSVKTREGAYREFGRAAYTKVKKQP